MRRLLPERSADVDLFEAFARKPGGPPTVRLGMVVSGNGLATDEEGWTGRLGGPADRRVLAALRAVSDGILVGAGSIRTGRYPPHRPSAENRHRRMSAGLAEFAPLVVVSGSLDLDWSLPAFTGASTPTLVFTSTRALASADLPHDLRRHLIVAGEDTVDVAACLDESRRRYGLENFVCEGGPRLAAGMLDARLVDELVLSLAPVLVPGTGPRVVTELRNRSALRLREIYEDTGEVFLRYEVDG
jgi:5-amino-6-(5-phosphoribosylamino)uracil reductase